MKPFCKLSLSIGLLLNLFLLPVCKADDEIVVPEGTRITLQLNNSLSTKDNQEGDDFDAYVIEPVYSKDQIIIPRGSVIQGSISRITRPGRFKGKALMHLIFQSIEIPGRGKVPIQALLVKVDSDDNMDIYTENIANSGESAGRKIDNLAIARLKGTGVGLGFTNVFWTRGKDLEIHRGSTMDISLKQDLKIPPKNQSVVEFTNSTK
jgi:hypothetical protein